MLSPAQTNSQDALAKTGISENAPAACAEFFGSSKRRLLGVLHKPAIEAAKGSVLICHPVGHEYLRCYRAVSLLSEHLCNDGYNVLHFDYSGTGDSDRSLQSIRLADWQSDVRTASQFLRARTGLQEQHVIAIRTGALIVMSLKLNQMTGMTLWDPIENGGDWLAEQRKLHRQSTKRLDRVLWKQQNSDPNEFFGYQFSRELLDDIASLDFEDLAPNLAKNLTVFRSFDPTHQPGIEPGVRSPLQDYCSSKCAVTLPEPCQWNCATGPDTPVNPDLAKFIFRRFRYGIR